MGTGKSKPVAAAVGSQHCTRASLETECMNYLQSCPGMIKSGVPPELVRLICDYYLRVDLYWHPALTYQSSWTWSFNTSATNAIRKSDIPKQLAVPTDFESYVTLSLPNPDRYVKPTDWYEASRSPLTALYGGSASEEDWAYFPTAATLYRVTDGPDWTRLWGFQPLRLFRSRQLLLSAVNHSASHRQALPPRQIISFGVRYNHAPRRPGHMHSVLVGISHTPGEPDQQPEMYRPCIPGKRGDCFGFLCTRGDSESTTAKSGEDEKPPKIQRVASDGRDGGLHLPCGPVTSKLSFCHAPTTIGLCVDVHAQTLYCFVNDLLVPCGESAGRGWSLSGVDDSSLSDYYPFVGVLGINMEIVLLPDWQPPAQALGV